MENLKRNLIRYFFYSGLLVFVLGIYSCSDDDDVLPDPFETEATITVQDQVVAQNMVTIAEVMSDEDAWLVIRKVNDDGNNSEPIAEPMFLEEGTHTDIEVQLETQNVTLEDGNTLIAVVHRDDDDGLFDFEDDPEIDEPFQDEFGAAVSATFEINAPSFAISDPTVTDNSLTFDSVTTVDGGFIVLHNELEDGTIDESDFVGFTYVPSGVNEDVVVSFEEGFSVVPGQNIFPRLYLDDPADQQFMFETDAEQDMPVFFGFGADNTITDTVVIP